MIGFLTTPPSTEVFSPPSMASLHTHAGSDLSFLAALPQAGFSTGLLLGGVAVCAAGSLWYWRERRRAGEAARARNAEEADRQAAVRDLRESEARYRALFDGVPVAVIEKDYTELGKWLDTLRAEGVKDIIDYLRNHPRELALRYNAVRVVSSNRTALLKLDLLDVELTDSSRIGSSIPSHLLGLFQREIEALWNGRVTMTFTLDYPKANGHMGHALLHWSAPQISSWPDKRNGLLVFTDLTELRQAEERLRISEERPRLALQGFNVGIWEYNYATGESHFSERWKKMLGYEVHDISNQSDDWIERVHPDDQAAVRAALEAHLRGETSYYESEHRVRCKDGSHKWVLSRGQALFDAQGRPSRIIGAHADISERKNAEEALRRSEAKYRELFENSIEGIAESTVDGRFLSVNPAFARMLGYASARELLEEQPINAGVFYLKPGRRDEFFALLGTSDAMQGFESELRRKDGKTLWVSENVRVLRDAQGRILRIHTFMSDVTARRSAAEALIVSEQRLRQIVQQSDCMLWLAKVHDREGQLVWSFHVPVSGLHRRLFGCDHVEGDGILWTEPMVPEMAQLDKRSNLAIRSGEHEYQHEFRFRNGDQALWLSEKVEITRQGADEWQLVGVVVDVTTRKQAEDALRRSEARYRQLVEHSPIGIIELDASAMDQWLSEIRRSGVTDIGAYLHDHAEEFLAVQAKTCITAVNNAAVFILRAKDASAIADAFTPSLTTDLARVRREAALSIWEGSCEIEGETSFRAIDGSTIPALFHWWVPRVDGLPDLKRTQLAIVDLSESRRKEFELADERERLRVMLRSMSEGVITTNTHGVVQYLNPAAERMTGWSLAESIGRPLGEVCVLHQGRTHHAVALPSVEHQANGLFSELPDHTMLRPRGGPPLLVEGRIAALRSVDEGRSLGAMLVLRDMTERSRLESEQLRSSKLESLGILAGGIAHDFNNLLTVVMGNLTLAMLDSQVMAAAGRWLKESERGVLRARDLTQQLLTFAKGGDPVRAAVSLADIVRETTEFAMHGAKARCSFDFASELWPADVDKGQIGQVVQNIVINAVQAMPEGGTLQVCLCNQHLESGTVGPLVPGRYLKLSITDTGMGIKAEHLARIFDPYFTTKPQGSGLGLATVYSIIRKHQGHIDVESQLGKGTSFHIWLPAAKRATQAEQPAKPASRLRAARILFMDDEEGIRRLGQALLQSLGYDVRLVPEGTAALREYELARQANRPFDIVMLDLTVPGGMGGLATLEALRKVDPQVRAIVTSGYSSDPVLGNYKAHGFLGVVPKPYRIADLGRVIQGVLNNDGEA